VCINILRVFSCGNHVSVLQYGAVWCSVLQCVAVCYSVVPHVAVHIFIALVCSWRNCVSDCCVLQCAAVCCSVAVFCSMWQCVAVCCSVLQCVAVCCSAYLHRFSLFLEELCQCDTVCCSELRCAVVCSSVLQCVAFNICIALVFFCHCSTYEGIRLVCYSML